MATTKTRKRAKFESVTAEGAKAGMTVRRRKVRKPTTVKDKLSKFIVKADDTVFLINELEKRVSASDRQLLRAIGDLVKEGVITRLGKGVYVKLKTNPYSGQPMLATKGGFEAAVTTALNKLGVPVRPTRTIREYNSGQSTQIPANTVLAVPARFRRKLAFKGMEAKYVDD